MFQLLRFRARTVSCCGGGVRLTGETTFEDNGAFRGGAIFSDDDPAATTTFPADTVFINNTAEVRLVASPPRQRRCWRTHQEYSIIFDVRRCLLMNGGVVCSFYTYVLLDGIGLR